MQSLNLSELFCEVLSGFLAILLAIVLADLFHLFPLRQAASALLTNLELGPITLVLVCSYLAGLLVDALGLTLGEWKLDAWMQTVSGNCNSRQYWQTAAAHAVTYREHQWAFYSMYRNILILLAIGVIPFVLVVSKYAGYVASSCTFLAFLILAMCMFFAGRATLDLYNRFPTFFE